jgi:hypothetical protein
MTHHRVPILPAESRNGQRYANCINKLRQIAVIWNDTIMLKWLRKQWTDLRGDPPGCRFVELHRRRQKTRGNAARTRMHIGIAVFILILGIAMMPLPGPGLPIVLVGAALLARESSRAARALDWLEVKLRSCWAWSIGRWRQT